MNGRLGLAVFGGIAAGMLVWAGIAGGQDIEPAPIPGPVGLSVGNESHIALIRAERWLERHKTVEDGVLPGPVGINAPDDGEIERLKPLLDGDFGCLDENENVFEAWGRLAAGLARQGNALVYRNGSFVPWRNAILHELVASQRSDDMGGGWWENGEADAQTWYGNISLTLFSSW